VGGPPPLPAMAEAFPTAKRRNVGLGIDMGKRARTSAFEDDGDEDEDDERQDRTRSKYDQPDLGNVGFQQSERKVIDEAVKSGLDGIKRYGDETGRWEEKDEKLEAFNLKEEVSSVSVFAA
jgi:hypothetical protein